MTDAAATPAGSDAARVIQLTDTHLSHTTGVPDSLQWLLDVIVADPPDAVALTGDLVFEDPDDVEDRRFARAVFAELPCPVLAIPGNHDVGFYGDPDQAKRIAAFRETWGADRFVADLAGWRLVGADVYLLGDADHDAWLEAAATAERPVAVFLHQPVRDDTADGWQMPDDACAAFGLATAGADVRLVASGHRHRYLDRGSEVWAPSATISGASSDGRCGAVEYVFNADGTVTNQVMHTAC